MKNNDSFFTGVHYFLKGFDVYKRRGFRRFAYLPLLINIIIFALCFYFGIDYLQTKLTAFIHWTLPTYLSFLQSAFDVMMSGIKWLLVLFMGLGLLIAIGLSASVIANLIASPFNALLAEKIDFKLTTYKAPDKSIVRVSADSLVREIAKLCYTLPRLVALSFIFLIFYFVPGFNLVVSFLFSAFGAWMLAFQYLDYAADNRQLGIKQFRRILSAHRSVCLGFGATCMFFTSLPVINLIIIPVAVAGASYLWVDKLALQPSDDI